MNTTIKSTIISARAKAFTGQGVRRHTISVDSDGDVRVWDSVAGHFTRCHSLGESAQKRLRKLAI